MQLITDSSIFIIKKKKSPFLFFPIIKVVMKNYKVNWVIIVFTPIKWVRLTFLKFLNVSLSWARQTIKWRNGLYIYKILMTLNEQLQNKTSKIKIKMNIFVVSTSHNTAFKNGQNVSISSKIQMFFFFYCRWDHSPNYSTRVCMGPVHGTFSWDCLNYTTANAKYHWSSEKSRRATFHNFHQFWGKSFRDFSTPCS